LSIVYVASKEAGQKMREAGDPAEIVPEDWAETL
jgi:hypothetical protein